MGQSVRVALVTGAGSGMGKRAAERLAAAGAQVAALDRDAAGLAALAATNPRIRTFPSDVTDFAQIQSIVDEVERTMGPIDRVVHAAGVMPGAPLLDENPETSKRTMRINYDGTIHVVHATLPKLLARRRGELVCFGSVAGHALTPRLGAYCASKAAVNAYVEVLAREHQGSGVTVHLVCPPMVNTPLLKQSLETAGPHSLKKAIAEDMLATPDQILDAIERALERGEWVSFPLVTAKALYGLRRFAPRLLWTIIERAEEAMAKGAA